MEGSASQGAPPPVQDDAAEQEPLGADFARASYADWEALARAKEADPALTLSTVLEEGLEVRWLYSAEDALGPDPGGLPGRAPFVRGVRAGAPWAIRQRNATPDRRAANAEILEELEGGATEILLALDPAGVDGIPVSSVDELDEVLDGVLLDLAPIALEGDPAGAELLLELLRGRGHPAHELRGSLRLDPIGSGVLELGETLERVKAVRAEFPHLQVLTVDTAVYTDAGAGGVLELALALATGVGYLRAGEAAGIDPADLAGAVEFTLGVGPDQFLEIARLRAARRLWASVLEHCGVSEERRRSPLYVRTSRRMFSSLDPWVNLLRGTTAAFAAAVGGADGITVLPFDEPYGTGVTTPGALGRRIARNTQLLLAEEASLHRVADPAGGAWYVESLTDQIARAAWREFQDLERQGGVEKLVGEGTLADRFAELTAARQTDIATRRRSMTGVNQFPLLGDDGLERPGNSPVSQTGEAGETPVLVRDAAQFEALRARAAALGHPTILLASTGPLSAHVGVTQWAKGFFEAGGIEAVASGVDADLTGLVAEHGFRVAAICVGRDSDPGPVVEALGEVPTLYAVGADIEGLERVRDGDDMVRVLAGLIDDLEAPR